MKQKHDFITRKKLEIPVWGGIECTVHRMNDEYGDQLIRNGHQSRITDLELIADLGIKTLRYPILWEKVAPEGVANANWTWADERLGKLKELGITPIVGFLHHGSGPKYTELLDPDFPEKFTEFAIAVAQRYPWLEFFTPINEPLTTARFSCLYGIWYPHLKSDTAFSMAVINQCKAIIMAMHEIKKIIKNAKLVQTEDLGKCHATPKMQYQADFENERRWISLDLLTGQLDSNPVMLKYFFEQGKVSRTDLEFFKQSFFMPDIIGINHYLTSERFLDENQKKYPDWSYASNGKDNYCDVDIVRADIHRRDGHYKILRSAALRYNLPLALTEVHLGSWRDAQLRWFMEAYNALVKLKDDGQVITGIAAWSMLGAYDWNSLLTQHNNCYEAGAFDVRSGTPQPTAIANLIQQLCDGEVPDHPVLKADGWWKNPEHVHFAFGTQKNAKSLPSIEMMFPENILSFSGKPILITGATGTLGRAFAHVCTMRNISYILLSRNELDITDSDAIKILLEKYQPWALINAAGFVKVDDAEVMPKICYRENAKGPAVLAASCAQYGIGFMTFSSDLVFDGEQNSPYVETSKAAPINIYGASKLDAENFVLDINPESLVVRTSAFFGPWDEYNFVSKLVATIREGKFFSAAHDQIITPTYIPDLVNHCLDFLIDQKKGVWHLVNSTALSWADFAVKTANMGGLNVNLIRPVSSNHLALKAKRPTYSALQSEKGAELPSVDDALRRYFSQTSH